MSVWALGSSPTLWLRVLCWWQSYGEGRAHLLSPTAGGGSVRACGEQTNRSQEHGWACGKKGERFKILNLRMALCLPLTKQINTIFNTLDVYVPKPTDFALSYLFQYDSITAAQITASHSEPAVENSLSLESKSGRHWPRIRTFISITINNLLLTFISAAQCLILGRMMEVERPFPLFQQWIFPTKFHCLEPQNTGDDPVSTPIFSHQVSAIYNQMVTLVSRF